MYPAGRARPSGWAVAWAVSGKSTPPLQVGETATAAGVALYPVTGTGKLCLPRLFCHGAGRDCVFFVHMADLLLPLLEVSPRMRYTEAVYLLKRREPEYAEEASTDP